MKRLMWWFGYATLSPVRRAGHVGLAGGLSAGIAVVAALTPDPRGFSTHEQLGLPPCMFRWLFDLPCPSCGLTTSVAQLLHGHVVAAWQAHPAGPIACSVVAGLLLMSLRGILRPFAWGPIFAKSWFHRGIVCGISGLFAVWFVRLVTRS